MPEVKLYYFLVSEETGLPIFQQSFSQNQEIALDGVLLSGFISALSMFISEISQQEEKSLQFAQYTFEGIVENIEDKFYTIIGENIFSYGHGFFKQLFKFIDKYFFKDKKLDPSQIIFLTMSVFESNKNTDILIPVRNSDPPYLWSKEAEMVLKEINGQKNLKEIAIALNLPLDVVYPIVKIFEHLGMVEIKLEFRDYVIFEKTAKGLLLTLEYEKDYQFLKKNFPTALEVLNCINSVDNFKTIKNKFPQREIKNDIYALIEQDLIRTISSEKHLQLLLFEYLTTLIENFREELNKRKRMELFEMLKIPNNPLMDSIMGDRISFLTLKDIYDMLYYEKGKSTAEIFTLVEPILEKIHELSEKVEKGLSNKVIGQTIINILDKYGFTLERFNLLGILCPEKYIS